MRALASHQCDPGANPGVDAICGLSLLLVLSLAPRGFSPGTPVFPSPKKPTFPNSNSTRNQVDKEPPCGYATCKSLFIYFYLFIHFSLDLVYLCSEKTDVRQPWTLKSWGGKLTLSTQLIKPEFMLRTLVDTTPTFIRNWTFSSGGSTRSSTHPDPKAMFPLYRLTLALTRKILTVGKQDARIVELCIPSNRTVFGGKMTSQDWQQNFISTDGATNR